MSTRPDRAGNEGKIQCHVCLKEVPASEAVSSEAEDYVLNFCGLDCFNQWEKSSRDYTRNEPFREDE